MAAAHYRRQPVLLNLTRSGISWAQSVKLFVISCHRYMCHLLCTPGPVVLIQSTKGGVTRHSAVVCLHAAVYLRNRSGCVET